MRPIALRHLKLGLLVSLIILSSCALIVVPYAPSGSAWPSRVFFERDYKFPSGGRIDLQIEDRESFDHSKNVKGRYRHKIN